MEKPIQDSVSELLHQYLKLASNCFGKISEGHEARRVHFICPILIAVCSCLPDAEILTEEDVDGLRVRAHGHFEFVLQVKSKRICIVEAKMEKMQQAKAQSLLGCEVLADVEELHCVYGIATNYLEWNFLKSCDDSLEEEFLTVEGPRLLSVLALIGRRRCPEKQREHAAFFDWIMKYETNRNKNLLTIRRTCGI
eukprot:Pompholyxophrys_punicea_v1_NODE_973_length_1080_cov_39.847805.p1 type:complete len:195 gc:universal NODE_973_length_1080_cov_39.847805:406-990(+)